MAPFFLGQEELHDCIIVFLELDAYRNHQE